MEAPIGSLIHNRILDPNIRKYLQLTQLALQYLLFCKKFLDKTVSGLHSAINDSSKDNSKLGRILKRKNQEIIALQSRIRELEKDRDVENFRCSKCTKSFNSYKHVTDHIERKHYDSEDNVVHKKSSPPPTPVTVTDKGLISTIKLELEVKQLKERLNAAEKDLQEQRVSTLNMNNNNRNHVKEVVSQPTRVDSGIQVDVYRESPKPEPKPKQETKPRNQEVQKVSEEVVSVKKLNDMMHEQTKMIEELRENERNSYKNELSDLRTGFKEAFQALKSSIDSKLADIRRDQWSEKISEGIKEAKSPKKDKLAVSQNGFIEESLIKIGHIDDVIREEHEHWETRFVKLERIFEHNQELMSNSLQSLSHMYSTKFNTLEKTIKDATLKQLHHEMTQSEPMLAKVVDDRGRSLNVNIDRSSKEGSSSPRKGSPSPEVRSASPKLTEKKVTNVNAIKMVKPVKPDVTSKGAVPKKLLPVKSPVSAPNVSKYQKNEKKVQQKPPVAKPKSAGSNVKPKVEMKVPEIRIENTAETQLDIFTAFRNRLKQYGIKHTNKSLSTPQMLAIKSQLVQDRLKSKKKHSLFSSIRSRLSSHVSKEAKVRLAQLKDDGFTKETSSSDRFECKHDTIEDIIEESSSSSSDSEDVVVAPFGKLPPLQEASQESCASPKTTSNKKPMLNTSNIQTVTKTSPLKLSNDSVFEISDSALTSTKLEDQLRRVLDSPIRRPSFPLQNVVKSGEQDVKPNQTGVQQKRVNFSSQPSKSGLHEGRGSGKEDVGLNKTKTTVSQLSLTNISDESDFNFSRYK